MKPLLALLLALCASALAWAGEPRLVNSYQLPRPVEPGHGPIREQVLDGDTLVTLYEIASDRLNPGYTSLLVVHEREGDDWVERGRFDGYSPCRSCHIGRLGQGMVLSGDHLLVGSDEGRWVSGAVYAFHRTPQGWKASARWAPSSQLHASYGSAIAVHGDWAMVGAPNIDVGWFPFRQPARGIVYVYRFVNGEWQSEGELAPEGEPVSDFGRAIALNADTAVIGVSRGAPRVFRLNRGRWRQEAVLEKATRLAIGSASVDVGARAAVAVTQDTAHVFHRPAGTWEAAVEVPRPHPYVYGTAQLAGDWVLVFFLAPTPPGAHRGPGQWLAARWRPLGSTERWVLTAPAGHEFSGGLVKPGREGRWVLQGDNGWVHEYQLD